jgi:hypothetical protein
MPVQDLQALSDGGALRMGEPIPIYLCSHCERRTSTFPDLATHIVIWKHD